MKKKHLTNWQAAGIGIGVGFVGYISVILFFYLLDNRFEPFIYFRSLFLGYLATVALLGLVVTLIGNRKGTKQNVWSYSITAVLILNALFVIFIFFIGTLIGR